MTKGDCADRRIEDRQFMMMVLIFQGENGGTV